MTNRAARSRHSLFLSLEPVLTCPDRRCATVAIGVASDLLTLSCRKCGAHWWASRFEAGDLRSQVLSQFDGDDHFVQVLDALGAPERIERPMFWQIWLTGHEQYHFTDRRTAGRILERTHLFMKKLVALLAVGA